MGCFMPTTSGISTGLTPALSRAARALLGWTIEELAATSGVGTSTIISFEAGQRTPIRANLETLARAFGAAGVIFLGADTDGRGLRLRKSAEAVRDLLSIGALKEPLESRLRRARERIGRFHAEATEFYSLERDADLRVHTDMGKLREQVVWERERRIRLRRFDAVTEFLEPLSNYLHKAVKARMNRQ
jgi:transcriptional regulator with XRE-family HTH domain